MCKPNLKERVNTRKNTHSIYDWIWTPPCTRFECIVHRAANNRLNVAIVPTIYRAWIQFSSVQWMRHDDVGFTHIRAKKEECEATTTITMPFDIDNVVFCVASRLLMMNVARVRVQFVVVDVAAAAVTVFVDAPTRSCAWWHRIVNMAWGKKELRLKTLWWYTIIPHHSGSECYSAFGIQRHGIADFNAISLVTTYSLRIYFAIVHKHWLTPYKNPQY